MADYLLTWPWQNWFIVAVVCFAIYSELKPKRTIDKYRKTRQEREFERDYVAVWGGPSDPWYKVVWRWFQNPFRNLWLLFTSDIRITLRGVPGVQGQAGKSAYDLWLEKGNKGSIEDFLSSSIPSENTSTVWGPKNQLSPDDPLTRVFVGKRAGLQFEPRRMLPIPSATEIETLSEVAVKTLMYNHFLSLYDNFWKPLQQRQNKETTHQEFITWLQNTNKELNE